jgi:hypothetical protein
MMPHAATSHLRVSGFGPAVPPPALNTIRNKIKRLLSSLQIEESRRFFPQKKESLAGLLVGFS